jgi:hypothetical protein
LLEDSISRSPAFFHGEGTPYKPRELRWFDPAAKGIQRSTLSIAKGDLAMPNDLPPNQPGAQERPEADAPDEPQPPAVPSREKEPKSPEKSDDVHGAPEPPD